MKGSVGCPAVEDLPPPPSGKVGWPWTTGTEKSACPAPVPRISIVTPSYNQAQFIEQTIRSILLQGYYNLEYVVMDGGSNDGAVDIIKKYERWIQHWESVPDRGQAHAINKGRALCTGEIFQWINSDDFLEPGVLHAVARGMRPKGIFAGAMRMVRGSQHWIDVSANLAVAGITGGPGSMVFRQPAVWLSASAAAAGFPLDEKLHYAFDWEMILRIIETAPAVVYSDMVLVNFRLHPASKTVAKNDQWLSEAQIIMTKLLGSSDIVKSRPQLLRLRDFVSRIEEICSCLQSPSLWHNIRGALLLLQRPSKPALLHSYGAIKRKFAAHRQAGMTRDGEGRTG
jgi:glycosyltransferase involved in cell wall biosynthesis